MPISTHRAGSRLPLVLLVLAVAFQLVCVYLPSSPPVPSSPVIGFDKLVHATIFGLPAAIAPFVWRRGARVWACWLALAAHAPVSEFLQMEVLPNRSGDYADALADLVGVGLGILVGTLLRRRGPRSAGIVE